MRMSARGVERQMYVTYTAKKMWNELLYIFFLYKNIVKSHINCVKYPTFLNVIYLNRMYDALYIIHTLPSSKCPLEIYQYKALFATHTWNNSMFSEHVLKRYLSIY